MADGVGCCGDGSFPALLSKYIGETVTIFTKSGGQSGAGFTGVILAVNECFVRLITRIGPAPACSLGNACSNFNVGYGYDRKSQGCSYDCGQPYGKGYGGCPQSYVQPASEVGAVSAGGWNGYPVCTVGSVTDIPVSAIVSFVHNAV